jgi:hypothetical protein
MMRSTMLCVLVASLSSCTNSVRSERASDARWSLGALSQSDCEAVDGIWKGVPEAEYALCVRKATDAGRPCSDGSQCIVGCVMSGSVEVGVKTRGICRGNDSGYGCFQEVRRGIAQDVICNDP